MSQYEAPAEAGSGAGRTVLYVILGVVLALAIVCGGMAFLIYRMVVGAVDTVVDVAHQGAVQAVRDADLEDGDKEKIVAQIDRVAAAYKAKEITIQQVTHIMENVFQGPIIMAGMCQHLQRRYVAGSGLSDEEKAEAKLTLERVARGAHERKITQQQIETAAASISEFDEHGSQTLKPSLTDEELRDFLAECKQLADDAGIPEEPYEIDIGEEVKQAVDDVLGAE